MQNILAMRDELERGREVAKQLGLMLSWSDIGGDDDSWTMSYAEDLVEKVVESFTNTIDLLSKHHHHHHQQQQQFFADSACLLPATNNSHDESHQSCSKRKSPTITHKYGTSNSGKLLLLITWEEDNKISPKQDGYVWRMYGEKIIQHDKYPRSYFRCNYKDEQGCEATKQVQRI